MHSQAIEPEPAWVARVPAAAKLILCLGIVVGTVLLPRRPHPAYWVPAVLLLALWLVCRMPARFAVPRLVVAEFFILGMGVLTLLVPAATPLFLSALLKSNLCVLAVLLLNWTTPFHEVLRVLGRIGVPDVLVTTLALMHRYVPVLREETRRMHRARASRTFTRQRRIEWGSLVEIVCQLFVRAVERAERIYLAMTARGWK